MFFAFTSNLTLRVSCLKLRPLVTRKLNKSPPMMVLVLVSGFCGRGLSQHPTPTGQPEALYLSYLSAYSSSQSSPGHDGVQVIQQLAGAPRLNICHPQLERASWRLTLAACTSAHHNLKKMRQ